VLLDGIEAIGSNCSFGVGAGLKAKRPWRFRIISTISIPSRLAFAKLNAAKPSVGRETPLGAAMVLLDPLSLLSQCSQKVGRRPSISSGATINNLFAQRPQQRLRSVCLTTVNVKLSQIGSGTQFPGASALTLA
jgi:hypothetical protein